MRRAPSWLLWALAAALLYAWLAPKIMLLPPRLTTNNWDREIVYRSARGDFVVHCLFYSHDSIPYWEGDNAWEDEHVCGKIPVDLTSGPPPQTVRVPTWGGETELHAPLIWGRLL